MKWILAILIVSIIFLAGCTTNIQPGTTTVRQQSTVSTIVQYDKASCEKIGGTWKNNACAMQGDVKLPTTSIAQTGGGGLVSIDYYNQIRNITNPDECRRIGAVWRDCAEGTCISGCFPPPNA